MFALPEVLDHMLFPEAIDDLEKKAICHDCVKESFLSNDIAESGRLSVCAYCQEIASCYPLADVADRVSLAFEEHYIRTPDYPTAWEQSLMSDRESSYDWVRDGTQAAQAIEDAARIPSDAAEDIRAILEERNANPHLDEIGEESEFDVDSCYVERSTYEAGWHSEWARFEQSMRSEARFFSRSASNLLAAVFGGIDKFKSRSKKALVVRIGPNAKLKSLYRARVFQSTASLKQALERPESHLGPPPSHLAAAGRMNARGISVFYGATNPDTALAEVRPPVGSRVVVARFDISRPLRLLNLTAFDRIDDAGSVFDPTLKGRLERISFLHTLGSLMTRAVMPDDETLDYLPTQAVADFLATENDPLLDGIIFKSVQTGSGRNIVLFWKAALVEPPSLREGTTVEAETEHFTDEGLEPDYTVYENVPDLDTLVESAVDVDPSFEYLIPESSYVHSSSEMQDRSPSLRLDFASLTVRHVESVRFSCNEFPVSRHKIHKQMDASDF